MTQILQKQADIKNDQTVLIIEDFMIYKDLMRLILRRMGYKAFRQDNAEHGVKWAIKFQPNLIIIDHYILGEVSWIGVAKQIKSNPHTAHIPILAMSADPADGQLIHKSSFNAYLGKPYQLKEFQDLVASMLSDK